MLYDSQRLKVQVKQGSNVVGRWVSRQHFYYIRVNTNFLWRKPWEDAFSFLLARKKNSFVLILPSLADLMYPASRYMWPAIHNHASNYCFIFVAVSALTLDSCYFYYYTTITKKMFYSLCFKFWVAKFPKKLWRKSVVLYAYSTKRNKNGSISPAKFYSKKAFTSCNLPLND